MRNKQLHRIIVILTALCIIITVINAAYHFLLPFILSMKYNTDFSDASSIGIIGGADGPTTIYVANSDAPGFTALFALLSIVGIIYIIRTKKKKENKDLDK